MNIIKRNISTKYFKYCKRFFYRLINLGFHYRPEEGLMALKYKMFLYFIFYPSKKNKFANELEFLKTFANKNFSYSFVFPYSYVFTYDYKKIKVFFCENWKLFYVIHHGKKLYYSREFLTETDVQVSYFCSCIEQDINSPHRYLLNNFNIRQNDIMVDIGAAEASFSLELIDNIKELYIFEVNTNWIEALNATFFPWKEKVHIINKYASNQNSGNHITLDSLLGNNEVNFIKIDVEGVELQILEGSKEVLANNKFLKLVICTYHNQNDAKLIEMKLLSLGFNCHFSNGYMLFILRRLKPPYFRKGLIRAKKDYILNRES